MTKMVKSLHHRGKEVPLHTALASIASQEGCDGEEYDLMAIASDYIQELEKRNSELEELRKNVEDHLNKVGSIIEEPEEVSICRFKDICILADCQGKTCEMFEDQKRDTNPGDNYKCPIMEIKRNTLVNNICVRCGYLVLEDLATRTYTCSVCGQRYWII